MSEEEGRAWRTPKRLLSYSVKAKLEVVEYSESFSIRKASEIYNVDRKCVRRWKRQREELQKSLKEGTPEKKRLRGGGRKLAYPDLEEYVYSWVIEQRDRKLPISRHSIQQKACQLSLSLDVPFTGGSSWLNRFMDRKSLSLRRKTTVCQKKPSEYIPTIVSHVLFVRKMRLLHNYDHAAIFAADETAIWIDCSTNTTVTQKGAKEVPVLTTGHDKLRITVMLTAKGNGTKLKPFVLLNRKRPIKELEKYSSQLEIVYAGKIWMDDSLTKSYLNKIIGTDLFRRRLLVWDSFRCHISESTKAELTKLKMDSSIIPGGCTKYIQPADVSWNKPFKDKMREQYNSWLSEGNISQTSGGNPRSAPPVLVCKWIVEAWNSITEKTILTSFKACGILNATDGSEDDLITAFKPGKECQDGLAALKERAICVHNAAAPNIYDDDIIVPSDDDDELMEVDAD